MRGRRGWVVSDHRQFSRVKFAARTVVEFREKTLDAHLLDISLKGALVAFGRDVEPVPEESCTLAVYLDSSDVVLNFDAAVVHFHDNKTGLRFTSFDIDSMIHLRSLLELNTANPDQVRSELAHFIGAS